MAYTIIDILQKLMDIEEDSFNLYLHMAEDAGEKSLKIMVAAKAIAKQEQKHVEYYKALIADLDIKPNDPIDVYLYDKVSKLLMEFKTHIHLYRMETMEDLIKFSLEFERSNIGLVLDIQGRLLEKISDMNNNIYKIISTIIEEEREHEKMFMDLLNYM